MTQSTDVYREQWDAWQGLMRPIAVSANMRDKWRWALNAVA